MQVSQRGFKMMLQKIWFLDRYGFTASLAPVQAYRILQRQPTNSSPRPVIRNGDVLYSHAILHLPQLSHHVNRIRLACCLLYRWVLLRFSNVHLPISIQIFTSTIINALYF